MALYKSIRQEDGVTTNYHRILYLTHTVNCQTSIAVISYVDKEARKTDIATENRPYRKAMTYELAYDETMTIETAYEYLKTLPQYIEAEDV